jgi:hypothetical protein
MLQTRFGSVADVMGLLFTGCRTAAVDVVEPAMRVVHISVEMVQSKHVLRADGNVGSQWADAA